MKFDEFILSKLIRQDIDYMSCQFSHPSNDLQVENLARQIREEGYLRNYSDDRIARERHAVINMIDYYKQRKIRNVIHFEIEDHLPLGGIFDLVGQYHNCNDVCEIKFMRVGHNKFLVLESSDSDIVQPFTIYQLESKTYFSTIKGTTPDPFVFSHDGMRFSLIVNGLNLISPSIVEQIIDGRDLSLQDSSKKTSYILYDNPMSLLLHEFSSKLPKYVDLIDGLSATSATGNKPVDDLTGFIETIFESIDISTPDDIVHIYPEWLQFCHVNGLSVMTLDELINHFWNKKEQQ